MAIATTGLFFHNLSCLKFNATYALFQSSIHVQFLRNLLLAEEKYIDLKFGVQGTSGKGSNGGNVHGSGKTMTSSKSSSSFKLSRSLSVHHSHTKSSGSIDSKHSKKTEHGDMDSTHGSGVDGDSSNGNRKASSIRKGKNSFQQISNDLSMSHVKDMMDETIEFNPVRQTDPLNNRDSTMNTLQNTESLSQNTKTNMFSTSQSQKTNLWSRQSLNWSQKSSSDTTKEYPQSSSGFYGIFKLLSSNPSTKSVLPSSKSNPYICAKNHYEFCLNYLMGDVHTISDSETKRSETVELSRGIIKDLKLYLNFRLEMISVYQVFYKNAGKCTHFAAYRPLLRSIKQKYFNNPSDVHPFLERLFFNAKIEYDIVLHLLEAADSISKMEYVSSTMKLFQIEREFDKWSTKLFTPQHQLEDSTESPSFSSPPSKLRRKFGTTTNIPSLLKERFSSTMSPTNSIPSSEGNFEEISSNASSDYNGSTQQQQIKKSLDSYTLLRWLLHFYKLCVSKYSLLFFKAIKKNPNSNQTFIRMLKDRSIVHYTEWIANFYRINNPEYIFLIYNATQDEGCSPSFVDTGYSLRHNCNRKLEKTQGIRQWPCIYYHPAEANENDIVYSNWPTLLTLIHENDHELNNIQNAYVFVDRFANKSYFISKLDERLYFCITYKQLIEPKSRNYKQNQEFITQINAYARFSKLFSCFT